MLAPGDRVTKLVERELIERADEARAKELVALAKAGGVVAGQVVALSLGAKFEAVDAVTRALLSVGGEQDGK